MLAQQKLVLSLPVSVAVLFIGIIAMYVTVDSDRQRVQFRLANGNMKVWGEDPFFITAKYRRNNGEIATNLLLGKKKFILIKYPIIQYCATSLIYIYQPSIFHLLTIQFSFQKLF